MLLVGRSLSARTLRAVEERMVADSKLREFDRKCRVFAVRLL
jgi:hypothetical protein